MTGLVYRSLGDVGQALVVLEAGRRVYVGLSRDSEYLHVVHPAAVDMVNADGAVILSAGQLTCTCKGSAYRGTCYRVAEAVVFEGTHPRPAEDIAWLRDSEAQEASRG